MTRRGTRMDGNRGTVRRASCRERSARGARKRAAISLRDTSISQWCRAMRLAARLFAFQQQKMPVISTEADDRRGSPNHPAGHQHQSTSPGAVHCIAVFRRNSRRSWFVTFWLAILRGTVKRRVQSPADNLRQSPDDPAGHQNENQRVGVLYSDFSFKQTKSFCSKYRR